MSDEERMDRAKRIRRMREGGGRSRRTEELNDDDSNEEGSNEEGSDGDDQTSDESTADESTDTIDSQDLERADTESSEGKETTNEGSSENGAEEWFDDADETQAVETESTITDSADGDSTEPPSAETTSGAGEETQTTESTGSHTEIAPEQTNSEDSEGGRSESDEQVLEETESEGVRAPLPEAEELEEALEGSNVSAEAETVTPGVEDNEDIEQEDEEETRVLEFTLGGEYYCLDIEYIEEIVKQDTITRVPNTPEFVEGVVDLRGQITTIVNPKVTIGMDDTEAGELIIVFDAEAFDDQGYTGWVVDDVRQVTLITSADVNDPPIDDDHIQGVIDHDDQEEFVIWTTPELAFEDEKSE